MARENHGAISNNAIEATLSPSAKASEKLKLMELNARLAGYLSEDTAALNINMIPTRIELVVVPLHGDTVQHAPVVIDVDSTRREEPPDPAGGS